MTKIKEVVAYLESIAPSMYQESYDNSGLLVGNPDEALKGVMVCLDAIEAVVDEAIEKGCNLIVAHHPIIFGGLKRLTGRNYVERSVMKAIKHDIAIYALHTNLDNVKMGVNARICEKIGLEHSRILSPKGDLKKLTILAPAEKVEGLKDTLFELGAGQSDHPAQISYASVGAMSKNKTTVPRIKLELLFPIHKKNELIAATHKAMEGDAFSLDISDVHVSDQLVGSGMIGTLPQGMKEKDFLVALKKKMNVGCIKYTSLLDQDITTVAVCGGAGGFLLPAAIAQGADIFITSDYKYHEFFDADGRIVIADIGHYESEQFTIDLVHELLTDKFSTFVLLKTSINTNPVSYL